jgi:DHA1 family inner membrane transport protein
MAFFGNDAVNRVNLHYAIQSLAQAGGGLFFTVYLLHAGVSIPIALIAQAAILAGRFVARPAILPLAKRWGLKPMVIVGCLIAAAQYPVIGQVHGVGPALAAWCVVGAIGDVFYWPSYHAYFAAVGDAQHRGHQLGAREAMVSVVAVAAPLVGAWALVTLGPGPMFGAAGLVQALAAVPLIGAPDVAVKSAAPGAFRAARLGVALAIADGWSAAWFFLVWQIVLFVALGRSFPAYGGAMALAALVGAVLGLLLGRHVDAGHGRRAVMVASAVATGVVGLRAVSLGSPWLALAANALGPLVTTLIVTAFSTASYNLAKASPCPMRFQIATEGGQDVGCGAACLVGAALAASGAPLSLTTLLSLPALAISGWLLRRYYGPPGAPLAIAAP